MASFNGDNYGSYVAVPQEQLPVGEVSGKVRVAIDSYTCTQNVYAIADVILMGAPLPKGARIIDAKVISPSLGTTGIVDFGYPTDVDYFVTQADAGGQAVKKHMASEAGLLVKLSAALQPQIRFSEASDAANGLVIQTMIQYVLE